jgi:hypothetical protein
VGFLNHGPQANRGLIDPRTEARPDQPRTPPHQLPLGRRPLVADLRHRGKYDGAPTGTRLRLALHHVVPWATLVGFWNALAERGQYAALREFATLFGRSKEGTKYWPEDMAAGRFTDRHGTTDLATDLCWWPWNLVRGPQDRPQASSREYSKHPAADPGDDLDDLSLGNGANAVHILAMMNVGRFMQGVIRSPGSMTEAEVTKAVARWLALSRHPVIEFDPAVWRIDRDGPGYSLTDKGVTYPLWFKRVKGDG